MLKIGDSVPTTSFTLSSGEQRSFADFRGKTIILYFYPKDDTPGCTLEAQNFRDHHADIVAKQAVVLGVSKDPAKSHCAFRAKYQLPFDLIVDTPESHLCETFGVWKEKSMYGKKFMGIERSTFVIDPQGKLIKEWRKVSVPEHVEEVLRGIALTKYNEGNVVP